MSAPSPRVIELGRGMSGSEPFAVGGVCAVAGSVANVSVSAPMTADTSKAEILLLNASLSCQVRTLNLRATLFAATKLTGYSKNLPNWRWQRSNDKRR